MRARRSAVNPSRTGPSCYGGHIATFSTDRRGDLWVGGNGVYKFNGESFERIH